jgi:hypothetical protein
LRALQARAPDDTVLNYTLGARLLGRDDDVGMALLKRAMERDPWEIVRCCAALLDYCLRKGRKEEAREWGRRMSDRIALEHAAKKERDEIRTSDTFERHGVDPAALAQIQAQLKAIPGLRKVYFVKKRVRHMPEHACYVLGFTLGGWPRWGKKDNSQLVLRRMQESVQFPGQTMILSVDGENSAFGRKFRWMRGARIV